MMRHLSKAGSNTAALDLVGQTEEHFRSARGFLSKLQELQENIG